MDPDAPVPAWASQGEFFAIARSEDELSIVCESRRVPQGILCEGHWRVLKVAGPLDFFLVGVLASLAATLADADVSIFAISTFDTDYLLLKADRLDDAVAALQGAGHQVFAR